MNPDQKKYDAIVIGASAGGLYIMIRILKLLPANFNIPIIVVQHRAKDERTLLEEVLQQKCKVKIKQADEKELIQPGNVYFAPPDYHLLIENDGTFSLNCDPPVNYSRPSIDVLFETAADVYKQRLLAIILTGANKDGSYGIKKIALQGGTTIAQLPETADYPEMPRAAISTGHVQLVLDADAIGQFLLNTMKNQDVC
ncbi:MULTISPECIES: chemotaxis protein CheB [Niastella]|uniref:protein-glutamate methylesterase n=1 Tax=Niastella soli TaxID=2821487 RepID=A0ABS3Z4S7_9BACT|nr:chemotaxis protein CheB [Niastella soli]MBO9205149.1 chemotaxis protein CheB [Niastella soli]